MTGHTTLVNSKALALAGITASTPNPEGGRIDHDPDGQPNGLLQDTAADPVFALIGEPPQPSQQRQVELARQRMRDFNREGITTFMQPLACAAMVRTFYRLSRARKLTARAHFAIGTELTEYKDRRTRAKLYRRIGALRREIEARERLPLPVLAWRPGRQTGPRLVAARACPSTPRRSSSTASPRLPGRRPRCSSRTSTPTARRAPTSQRAASSTSTTRRSIRR